MSGARACGLLHLAVSSYYYQPHGRREETPLREALRRHAAVRRRWGYRRLTVLLRRDGFTDQSQADPPTLSRRGLAGAATSAP